MIGGGGAWGPVALPVFKTGAHAPEGAVGVFDSHAPSPTHSFERGRYHRGPFRCDASTAFP